jgi:sn-glycerol 3-phosphate transport system substrate-binding protein
MRRRRVGCAVLAAGLLLAGCSSGSSSDDGAKAGPGGTDGSGAIADLPACPTDAFKNASGPVDIVIWYALSAKVEETLKAQVEKFNGSQTKVKVRAEKQGEAYEELLRKYEAGIKTKALPDIVMMEDTATRFMIDSDTVLPAESCLRADGISKDQFVKTAVDHYSVNNVLYPASASLSDILTYYNKNHFRKAGLDPEKPPTTLAEVRQYAEKIKASGLLDKDGASVKPVVLKLDSWFIETQLTGAKQPVVNNDNGRGTGDTTEATFDTPKTVEIFKWVKDMYKDGLLEPIPATEGQVQHYLALAAQKSSIGMETSTAATSIKAFLGGDTSVVAGGANAGVDTSVLDIGAGPAFGVDGAGKAQIGGNAFWLTKTGPGEKQGASWEFMKWWNQSDQQVAWHMAGSYLPFLLKAVDDPNLKTFWTTDIAGKWLAIAYKELREGVNPDFTGPLIGPYNKFRPAIRSGLDSLVFKDEDPQKAVTKAASDTTAALKEYNDANF